MLQGTSEKLKNKHSAGDDGISNNLLKKMTPHILEPLTYLINLSFEKGVFPNRLKIARVVPVYKKCNTADCRNYRPVSLLSGFSKVFEYAILERISGFYIKHDFLSKRQFGFLQGR